MPNSIVLSSLGKKYLSASTGCLLGVFLFAHALGNGATFFGRATYNAYAAHLHRLGPFLKVPETILALLLATHVVTGLLLFLENRRARPQRYAVSPPFTDSLAATTMPYTGLIILIFLTTHLLHFHLASRAVPLSTLVKGTLSQLPVAAFYLGALLALGLHLFHGFWSLLQTFGINHPRYNDFFLLAGRTGALVISGVFMLIVLLSLFSPSFLR